MMHILILGAGALGSLLGARLSPWANVSLLSTNIKHIQTIQKKGLIIEETDGRKTIIQIPSFYRIEDIQKDPDLILVLVKSYDTEKAVSSIPESIRQNSLFLTLQNGIGNWEKIAKKVPKENILAGVTSQGATFLGPGLIKHGGDGPSFIGQVQETSKTSPSQLVDIFNKSGLGAEVTEQTNKLIWKKLIINIGINALTAITGVKNGLVAQNRNATELAKTAVQEALLVAKNQGFTFEEDMEDQVIQVAQATSENISSMNQDIRIGKKTEIDDINGAIVRIGKEYNLETPVNWTLTKLIKVMEEKN